MHKLLCILAGVEGIEPSIMVLETIAIPFNYAPKNLRKNIITSFACFVK